MITQINQIAEAEVQENQEIDFGDIMEEIYGAIGRLQKLINDYNNWERYSCDGDCSEDEYQKAATERIKKLRKVVFGLMVDSGTHRQLISKTVAPVKCVDEF